jgi:ribosomal protein S13
LNGDCERCGYNGKLYYTFGNYICQDCLDEQSTDRDGHSGMVEKDFDINDFYEHGLSGLNLVQVKKSNPLFVNLFFKHYPDSKGIIGRQLNYLIYRDEKPIGAIGFASPIYNYNKFKNFFDEDDPDKLAKTTLNNNVYRLMESNKNTGTKILRKARESIYSDYYRIYNDKLQGLCTFVEPPRDGAVYKADNWSYLGKSEGVTVERRGDDWNQKSYKDDISKHVFCYEYDSQISIKEKHDHIYKSYNMSIRGNYSRQRWLTSVDGIGESRSKYIINNIGFEEFIEMDQDDVQSINGIGAKTVQKIQNSLPDELQKSLSESKRSDNKRYWKHLLRQYKNTDD